MLAKPSWSYARRALIVAGILAGAYLAWQLSAVLLLLFGAILVASLLSGAADLLVRHTFLNYRMALTAIALLLALLLGGLLVGFGAGIYMQFAQVFERAPDAIDAAGKWFGISGAAARLTDAMSGAGIEYFSQAATAGYAVINAVAQSLLVLVAALYLASDPALYRRGAAKLFPKQLQDRILDTMSAVASALRLWFLGQLISMLLVGALSAAAFAWIGLPMPIGLGAIAGITNFIPIVGPFLGSVPAVLFAFTLDVTVVGWTIAAIVVIQQIDGYVATPLIQRQIVALPPALLLFALVALGVLFGGPGIVLAAPLTVATMVVVQKFWVREVIGERVKVAGEGAAAPGDRPEVSEPAGAPPDADRRIGRTGDH